MTAPAGLSSRRMIAWAALAERRARRGWWTSSLAVAIVLGGGIAAWVAWRATAGPASASHAWVGAAVVAFSVAFLRVPFHLYWRADAALLAQLPIEGGPLFDAAMVRCVRAAAATTLAALIGAAPLARDSLELAGRHAALALALGAAAALLLPAVATAAAAFVSLGQRDERVERVRAAAGLSALPRESSTAMLGALPGFVATIVLIFAILLVPWLDATAAPSAPPAVVLGAIAAASAAAFVVARAAAPRVMGAILRDVSALDRQRLANLEIRPPTALERAIARLAGDAAAVAYTKDARLMRRRYPMAFALGALAFIVLVIVGFARPTDPVPWLTVVIGGAAAYLLALAGRLRRPPIELPRLSATLPIPAAASARAKHAWLLGWWTIFVVLPGVFAAVRQPDPAPGLALVGAGTAVALLAGAVRAGAAT